MKRNRIARGITLTPLGERILRQVAAGTYKFAPTHGNVLRGSLSKYHGSKGRK